MGAWMNQIHAIAARKKPCVLVTVAVVKGSTPREAGAKMLVTTEGIVGSIGGGHLELKAIDEARALFEGEALANPFIRDFALGPSLGQCCGGFTSVLFELLGASDEAWLGTLREAAAEERPAARVVGLDDGAKAVFTSDHQSGDGIPEAIVALARAALEDVSGTRIEPAGEGSARYVIDPEIPRGFRVVLFGAGHVGTALVSTLASLPCRVTWIDSRDDFFPADLPANVTTLVSDLPAYEVDDAAPGALYLVMTHSHGIDLQICERVLKRGDFAYLGLIGSKTKRERFRRDLGAKGLPASALERITCPIGIPGISGKHPNEIAVAVAAELLQIAEAVSDQHADGAMARGSSAGP
jgi:xanthine dehydrogenase accessory factor